MDCRAVRQIIQDYVDGRLAAGDEAPVREHVRTCPECAAEEASVRRVGELLRLWSGARVAERTPQLDAMWTRIKAGIDERREKPGPAALIRRWFWVPAAVALAVLALLFYPSDGTKAPFHPKNFEVSVEDLESDAATVAFVDKGEELPRVIWIIDDGKT